jgi:NADPH:quinone reductase-like Zn-dependent oxidoreductase
MRALVTPRYGGPEVLEVRELPDPVPQAGQVRIRVHRAGLNFADVAARVGLYPDAPKPPMVVGYEVAGEVDALGEGVTGLAKGDRVLALTRFNGQAELAVTGAPFVLKLPESVDLDAAAALPVNYLTAFHMLHNIARVRAGEHLLIHMAAGGVGLALIQLARRIPEVTLYGTASASKHPVVKEAGLDHPIDYRSQDYATEIRRLTNGRGVDAVFDALGGKDWLTGYELLVPGGHLVAFGWANMVSGTKRNPIHAARELLRMPRFSPMRLMSANKTVSGVNVGHLWDQEQLLRPALETLIGLLAEGAIRPHVDAVFPLSKAADAHAHMQRRKNVGKVLFDTTA